MNNFNNKKCKDEVTGGGPLAGLLFGSNNTKVANNQYNQGEIIYRNLLPYIGSFLKYKEYHKGKYSDTLFEIHHNTFAITYQMFRDRN